MSEVRSKKFLTVCEGGVVRSVSLAFLLKAAGQDAVAASWRWNTAETLATLCDWADYIIILQAEFESKIHERYHPKTLIVDVGPDTFGNPLNEALIRILAPWVEEHAANGFDFSLADEPEDIATSVVQ